MGEAGAGTLVDDTSLDRAPDAPDRAVPAAVGALAAPGARQSTRWWRRMERFRRTPARWWWEALLFFAAAALYSRIQEAVPASASAAMARGQALWDAEGHWQAHPELWLNRQLVAHHRLAVVADYWYVLAHLGVTVSVLVWLFVAHRAHYRRCRLVLLIASLVALAVFWLAPTAPPRLLPHTGLVDTVIAYHTWGSYESGSLKSHADLLASMPSLHVGWALWSGAALALFARWRIVRWLGVLYPVLTILDVLATGNHDLLDVAGGSAVVAVGAVVVVVLTGRRVRPLPTVPDHVDEEPVHPPVAGQLGME